MVAREEHILRPKLQADLQLREPIGRVIGQSEIRARRILIDSLMRDQAVHGI